MAAKFKIGQQVRILAAHMPELLGQVVPLAEIGEEPYYAVRLPDGSLHKWFSESELQLVEGRTDRSVRRDVAPIALGATPVEIRPNGWRIYEGTAGFGDLIQEYPDLHPPRSEFRPAAEALSDATLASGEGVPVTLDHPDVPGSLLVPENTKQNTEGTVFRIWKETGNKIRVRLIVYTPELQRNIESGDVDLSLGYEQEGDPTPGEFQGRRYDRVQRKIRINHLAVVPNARAVRPDGTHARLDREAQKTSGALPPATYSPKEASPMDKLSEAGMAHLAQLSEADRAILGLVTDPAGAPLPAATNAEQMKAEDEAQDARMLAPILERLAAVEAAIKDLQGAEVGEDAPAAIPTKDESRKDSAIDIEQVVKEAETRALASIERKQRFIESVRVDGHKANTADDAAAVMLGVVKDHLGDLHTLACIEHKAGRLDSLTQIYKSADNIRRNALLAQQAAAVVGAPIVRQEPLFTLPM